MHKQTCRKTVGDDQRIEDFLIKNLITIFFPVINAYSLIYSNLLQQ